MIVLFTLCLLPHSATSNNQLYCLDAGWVKLGKNFVALLFVLEAPRSRPRLVSNTTSLY